jgi:hypothetical protein
VRDSNFLIRVTLRAIIRGVSILYLMLPVASSTSAVRRGEFLASLRMQPLIQVWRKSDRRLEGDRYACHLWRGTRDVDHE